MGEPARASELKNSMGEIYTRVNNVIEEFDLPI